MRIQIILELLKTEIEYLKSLEILQKYYVKPLKACFESGNKYFFSIFKSFKIINYLLKRIVISQSVFNMLFSEINILYKISK